MACDAVTCHLLDQFENDKRESVTHTFRTTYEEDETISNSNAFTHKLSNVIVTLSTNERVRRVKRERCKNVDDDGHTQLVLEATL